MIGDLSLYICYLCMYRLGAGDPYNAGKMLSRMARVALIAEHMGRLDIAERVVAKLKVLPPE
jgi:hypothetical protein